MNRIVCKRNIPYIRPRADCAELVSL